MDPFLFFYWSIGHQQALWDCQKHRLGRHKMRQQASSSTASLPLWLRIPSRATAPALSSRTSSFCNCSFTTEVRRAPARIRTKTAASCTLCCFHACDTFEAEWRLAEMDLSQTTDEQYCCDSSMAAFAGAAEPDAAALTMVENDETLLRVAFYNVGMQQSALDTKTSERADKRCRILAFDIAEGFRKHRLEPLCLRELGEHKIGLQCRKNLRCESQDDLLRLIVRMTNEDLACCPSWAGLRPVSNLRSDEPSRIQACGGGSVVPLRSGEETRKASRPHDVDFELQMDGRDHQDNELSLPCFHETFLESKREKCRAAQRVPACWFGVFRQLERRHCRACRLDLGWRPQSRREHHSQRDE